MIVKGQVFIFSGCSFGRIVGIGFFDGYFGIFGTSCRTMKGKILSSAHFHANVDTPLFHIFYLLDIWDLVSYNSRTLSLDLFSKC